MMSKERGLNTRVKIDDAETLDDFILTVSKNGGRVVMGRIKADEVDGHTIFSVRLESSSLRGGKKIIYEEPFAKRNNYGLAEDIAHRIRVIHKNNDAKPDKLTETGRIMTQGLLTVDERLGTVSYVLKCVQTIGPMTGMSIDVFTKMQTIARDHNIRPLPEPVYPSRKL